MLHFSLVAILRLGAILLVGPLLWAFFRSEKARRRVEREREEHLASERRYRQDQLRERGD
jgi:hypothetical protein